MVNLDPPLCLASGSASSDTAIAANSLLPTSQAQTEKKEKKDPTRTALIVGSVLGVTTLLAIITVIVVLWQCRRRRYPTVVPLIHDRNTMQPPSNEERSE